MNTYLKTLIGFILILGSAYYVLTSALSEFIIVLKGSIPILLFLVGLLIIWLELDELKLERKLRSEKIKSK